MNYLPILASSIPTSLPGGSRVSVSSQCSQVVCANSNYSGVDAHCDRGAGHICVHIHACLHGFAKALWMKGSQK